MKEDEQTAGRKLLPEEFRFAHEYCFGLHNRLVSLIHHGDNVQAYKATIKFKSDEDAAAFESVPGGAELDWLGDNGYDEYFVDLLFKRVFPALLSDLCHFLYEALSTCAKGKLVVSWTLLRKPFKESLHYLECLLVEREKMLNTLYHDDPAKLALILSSGHPEEIVRKACASAFCAKAFNPEFIYEARYDKTSPISLDRYWTQAPHIITHTKLARTAKQSLNFIFDSPEDQHQQYEHFFFVVPLLLFYTVDICEVLMANVLNDAAPFFKETFLHRVIGFIVCRSSMTTYATREHGRFPMIDEWDDLVFCPRCKENLHVDVDVLMTLYRENTASCDHCGKRFSIDDMACVA